MRKISLAWLLLPLVLILALIAFFPRQTLSTWNGVRSYLSTQIANFGQDNGLQNLEKKIEIVPVKEGDDKAGDDEKKPEPDPAQPPAPPAGPGIRFPALPPWPWQFRLPPIFFGPGGGQQGQGQNRPGGDDPADPPDFPPLADECGLTPMEEGEAVLAVIPDTQKAVLKYPKIFLKQMEWLASQRRDLDLTMVVFLGDLVDTDTPEEWRIFDIGLKMLEAAGMPVAIGIGNHDYPQEENKNRSGAGRALGDKQYDEVVSVKRFQGKPNFGGAFFEEEVGRELMDNSYYTFSAGDRDFLLLELEFGMRDSVITEALRIIAEHPEHEVIMATHNFLNPEDRERQSFRLHGHTERFDPYSYGLASESYCTSKYDRKEGENGCVNDGEQIGEKLVDQTERMFLTLSGHLDGVADVKGRNNFGENVCQYSLDFQNETNGGNGYLALLRLRPADSPHLQQVDSLLYSPVLNKCRRQKGAETYHKSLCVVNARPQSETGGSPEDEETAGASPFGFMERIRNATVGLVDRTVEKFRQDAP